MDTEKRGIECLCLSQRLPGPGRPSSESRAGARAGREWRGRAGGRGGVGAPAPSFFFFLFRGCKFLERGEGAPGKGGWRGGWWWGREGREAF